MQNSLNYTVKENGIGCDGDLVILKSEDEDEVINSIWNFDIPEGSEVLLEKTNDETMYGFDIISLQVISSIKTKLVDCQSVRLGKTYYTTANELAMGQNIRVDSDSIHHYQYN